MALLGSNVIFSSWCQVGGNYIIEAVLLKHIGALALFPYLFGFLDAVNPTTMVHHPTTGQKQTDTSITE